MQKAWLLTMFVFSLAFFLIFFTVYFFRPRKEDKISLPSLERGLLDPEDIALPQRAEPDWPAILETASGQTADARITSISHGSGFLTSATELMIGEKFQLTIQAPDRPPLQLRAEVTWSNMRLPAEKVLNRGMGIRFIEAGPDAVCLINDTIRRQGAVPEDAAGHGPE